MPTKHVCPRCGQDWVHPYRFLADGAAFLLCTECDSLWWPGEVVETARAKFLDDVVAERRGVQGNPWGDLVWADVIEPAPVEGAAPGRSPGPADPAPGFGTGQRP
ncbi:hypothetical protein [Streptomyces sp. NPDC001068]|uniref:hypothetical protein n=1 Tax=Streptomyces sp. NPDC001068 TaxID=3364544 RepID=UPI00368DE069